MEQPNNIDQFFRERLQGAEVPPPAFVWPNVEYALRQRRRRFLLWLWFGLGLTGAGGWALWSTTTHRQTIELTVVKAPKPENVTPAGLGSLATRDEDYARTGPISETAASPAVRLATKPTGGLNRDKSGVLLPGVSNRATRSPSWGIVSAMPILDVSSSSISPTPGAAPAIENQTLSASELLLLPSATPLLLSGKAPLLVVLPKAKPFIFKKKAAKNCYNFAQHARVWLFDAYAGPSLPQRQLTAAQPAFENYLSQRRNTEKSDWAFNAGIRGSLLFGQHFLLRTGLDYQQRTEVFEYADPDFIQVTIRQTIKIIDNIPVTVIDTIGVEYGEHYVKTFNRYGQLDVPIMAGVEFRNGRAGLSLQAGASLNVYFWKHGTSLDAQGSPASFTPNGNGDSRVFRQRAGWSTTASAQVFYHLRPRLRVFAEPYYHYNLRPLTLVGQPVAQRYTTWGLKLGITKILD